MPTDDVDAALGTCRFGSEVTGTDEFARDDLAARLQRRRIAVKQALLDQRVVAGLGNIYVDEASRRACTVGNPSPGCTKRSAGPSTAASSRAARLSAGGGPFRAMGSRPCMRGA